MENGDDSSVENMEPEPEDDLHGGSLLGENTYSSNEDIAEDDLLSKSRCSDANDARTFTPTSDQLNLSTDEESRESTLDTSLVEGGAALKHALESFGGSYQATEDLQLSSDSSLSDLNSSYTTNNDEQSSDGVNRFRLSEQLDSSGANEPGDSSCVKSEECPDSQTMNSASLDDSFSQDSCQSECNTGRPEIVQSSGGEDCEKSVPVSNDRIHQDDSTFTEKCDQMGTNHVHLPVGEIVEAVKEEEETSVVDQPTEMTASPQSDAVPSLSPSSQSTSTPEVPLTGSESVEESLRCSVSLTSQTVEEGKQQTCDSEIIRNEDAAFQTSSNLENDRSVGKCSDIVSERVDDSEMVKDTGCSELSLFENEDDSRFSMPPNQGGDHSDSFQSPVKNDEHPSLDSITEDKLKSKESANLILEKEVNSGFRDSNVLEACSAAEISAVVDDDCGKGRSMDHIIEEEDKDALEENDESNDTDEVQKVENTETGDCDDIVSEDGDKQPSEIYTRINGNLSESMDCDIIDDCIDDVGASHPKTLPKSEKPIIMSKNLNLAWKKAFANTARRYQEGHQTDVLSPADNTAASDSSCILSQSDNSRSPESVDLADDTALEDGKLSTSANYLYHAPATESTPAVEDLESALSSPTTKSNSKVHSLGIHRKMRARKTPPSILEESTPVSSVVHQDPYVSNLALGQSQCWDAQPRVMFKCVRCGLKGFTSMYDLRNHQMLCLRNPAIPLPREPQPSTTPDHNGKIRITRKVFLCSACGTYYENWNLFLHMREVHKRHICLFCLGMFSQAEKLSLHLVSKHKVSGGHYASPEDFKKSFKGLCFLMCCTCERMFTEENFTNHICKRDLVLCNICHGRGFHAPSCQLINSPRDDSAGDLDANPSKCSLKALETVQVTAKENSIDQSHSSSKYNRFSGKSKPILKVKIPTVPPKRAEERRVPDMISHRSPVLPTASHLQSSLLQDVLTPPLSLCEPGSSFMSNLDKTINAVALGLTEEAKAWEERMEAERRRVEEARQIYTDTEAESESEPGEVDNEVDELPHSSSSSESEEGEEDDNEVEEVVHEMDNAVTGDAVEQSNQELESLQQVPEWTQTEGEGAEQNPCNRISTEKDVNLESIQEEREPLNDEINEGSTVSDLPFSDVNDPDSQETFSNLVSDHVQEINMEPDESGPPALPSETSSISQELMPAAATLSFNEDVNPSKELDISLQNISGTVPALESDNLGATETDAMNIESTATNQNEPNVESVDLETNGPFTASMTSESAVPNVVERTDVDQVEEKLSDGLTFAGEDVPETELSLEKPLHTMKIQEVLKECVRYLCWSCVYCSHAKKIAVNGKQLALHMLSEHRVVPVDDVQSDTPARERLISKLKDSLDFLQSTFFNTDSYDSTDKANSLPYDRSYECFHCHFYTRLHKELYIHNRKMHQKTILLCIMCKSNFYSYSELLSHLCPGIYIPQINISFRCCMCDVDELPSAFRLMVHLRKKHNACDVCLEVTDDQQKLSNHVWKHKLHHLCYRCGIAYRNKPDITKHLFWKHGTESVLCKKCLQKKWPHVYHFCVPPAAFTCEECSAMFSRAVALRVHKRYHSEDFRYPCTECEDKFVSKKLLSKHLEKHKASVLSSAPTAPPSHLSIESAPVEVKDMEAPVSESDFSSVAVEKELVKNVPTTAEGKVETNKETPKSAPASPQNSKQVKKKKQKRDESEQESKQKKAVDVFDLPPLNLSSESDSSDEEMVKKTEETVPTQLLSSTTPPHPASLLPSDDRQEPDEPAPVLDGIWDKFQNFQASLEKRDPVEEARLFLCKTIMMEHDYCLSVDKSKPDNQESSEVPDTGDKSGVSEQKAESSKDAPSHELDVNGTPKSSPLKKKKALKRRKRTSSGRASSSSSSDSSSDSDSDSSSSSCGSNCSCSSHSSSSSSSSSSSDSDDSSSSEGRRRAAARREKRKEKAKEKNAKKEEENVTENVPSQAESNHQSVVTQLPVEELHIDVMEGELTIRESDLDTTETDTDEDFYDDNPQKLANELLQEKRNLMLLAAVAPTNNGGLSPAQSHSSQTPSAAPSEATPSKRRSKKRKKKNSSCKSIEEQTVTQNVSRVSEEVSEWPQLSESTHQSHGLQSNSACTSESSLMFSSASSYYNPSLSVPASISPGFRTVRSPVPSARQTQYALKQSASKFPELSAQSAGSGSETEGRMKRKRMRNKFYGYSSNEDDDGSRQTTTKQRKLNLSSSYQTSINYQSSTSYHSSSSYQASQYETPAQPLMPPLTIKRSQIKSVPASAPPATETLYESSLVPTTWSSNTANQPKSDSDSDSDAKPTANSSSDTDSDDDAMHIAESPPPPPQLETPRTGETQANLYCYCQCPYDEVSEMIACDGENCKIEWFHFECVGIMVPPKGQWYCPDCRRRMGLDGQEYVLNN